MVFVMTSPTRISAASNEVAYWSFDEGSGLTAQDTWGSNDGSIMGATWSTGKVNDGLDFDGDDYIEVGKPDLTSSWTVGVWVKYDNNSANKAVILSSDHIAIKAEQYDNQNKVGYTRYGIADYTFDYSLPNNVWTHLTFVGETTGVKLYVNGVYQDSHTQVINCPMTWIGKGTNNLGHFIGSLDELKIYSKALTLAEIRELAGVPYAEPELSKASRMLIEKGFQIQAWVTTDETDRYDLNVDDWDGINFTTPTYYEAPMYNSDFHTARPNSQWSLAKAPHYNQLTYPPYNNNHFLSQEQRDNLDNLVSMCFGDEESYSYNQVSYLKAWYDLSRTLYPDVLVHNNQWNGQWSEFELRDYFNRAKPDLMTMDSYYFDENNSPGYNFVRLCANALGIYRELALEGYDGTGDSPIVFGQYLLGYITGDGPWNIGSYLVSESQLNLIPFTTITMGGKWLNYFRWLADSKFYSLIYDNQNGGIKRIQYDYYSNMAKEVNNLGDHLVRLNSTDVYMVSGKHLENGQEAINILPTRVSAWNSSVDEIISDITVENLGQLNDQLAGDVMVGYFEPLKGLTDEMKSLFTSDNPQYFMILNGLVNDDGLTTPEKDMVTCEDAKQRITLTLDLGARNPDSLKRVSRQTGQVETVALTLVSGTTYTLQIELGGGKADLFYWE